MTERFDAVQAALRCPSCGSTRRYAPEAGNLTCDSCGLAVPIEVDERTAGAAQEETDYRPGAHDAEPPEIDHAHRCDACGGEVMFVGRAVSEQCPYCDGPVILGAGKAQYMPSALIPFRTTQAEAEANIRAWTAARWAAPGRLAADVEAGHIAAVYAPFWTFDTDKAITYSARKRVRRGKSTRWKTVRGQTRLSLDDTLIGASDHVTADIRDSIMHGFAADRLKPYLPQYLAGFAAEMHGQSVSDGLDKMRKDVEVLVHRKIRSIEGSVSNIQYQSSLHDTRFRRVLLPLWIHHFMVGGKPMRVVVSGIDGRTFGQRPFSLPKLLGYSAAVVVPVFVLGMAIGAGLAP